MAKEIRMVVVFSGGETWMGRGIRLPFKVIEMFNILIGL